MATSAAYPAASSSSGALNAHDQFLIDKSEKALKEGMELRTWYLKEPLKTFPLDLGKQFRLPNRAEGYFGTTRINGQPRSVMGCRQFVEFGRLDRADAAELLKEFALGHFLTLAHWTYPDGWPGGFTVKRTLYRDHAGAYGKFPEPGNSGAPDWRDLQARFQWVLLTLDIHDFTMNFGSYVKHLQEAAAVTMNKDFVDVQENPSDDCRLRISLGYPFIDYAPIPNIFGYGPGKFGIAVKLYEFSLGKLNQIRVKMDFLSAPRSERVFDFGRNVPDPVYTAAHVLSFMTLGFFKTGPFHDYMDQGMLGTHCRVHQALMDGTETVFRDWVKTRK